MLKPVASPNAYSGCVTLVSWEGNGIFLLINKLGYTYVNNNNINADAGLYLDLLYMAIHYLHAKLRNINRTPILLAEDRHGQRLLGSFPTSLVEHPAHP